MNNRKQGTIIESMLCMGRFINFCAIVSTVWILALAFYRGGIASAVIAFIALFVLYNFGATPLLVGAATGIYFIYHGAGLWLPVSVYFLVVVSIVLALANAFWLSRNIDTDTEDLDIQGERHED